MTTIHIYPDLQMTEMSFSITIVDIPNNLFRHTQIMNHLFTH